MHLTLPLYDKNRTKIKAGENDMWIQTHYYLAKQIHSYIKEKYSLDLRLDLLQYGSIKPDIHWSYRDIAHYYQEGHSYWLEEVGQLLKDPKYQNIKDFSQKLGIVLHFTADFFTFAHNNEELEKNMLKHLAYELKLHQAFIHNNRDLGNQRINYGNAYSLIKNLRQNYLTGEASFEKDTRYIYTACFLLTDLMLEAVLLPAVQAA